MIYIMRSGASRGTLLSMQRLRGHSCSSSLWSPREKAELWKESVDDRLFLRTRPPTLWSSNLRLHVLAGRSRPLFIYHSDASHLWRCLDPISIVIATIIESFFSARPALPWHNYILLITIIHWLKNVVWCNNLVLFLLLLVLFVVEFGLRKAIPIRETLVHCFIVHITFSRRGLTLIDLVMVACHWWLHGLHRF